MSDDHFVSWMHVGDLHASDEDGWASVDTLSRIVASLRSNVPDGALDFAFLPGDNANHGEREQYARIVEALSGLDLPVHAIPGDHDFEPGSLHRFEQQLGHRRLPAVVRMAGRRALFLDIVSAGGGGPDFRLGPEQTDWLREQLRQAVAAGEPRPLVFMHAFPGDLGREGPAVGRLFADAGVAVVDTGHTHYNELLNDGAVIYSATRSTGQFEEGPPGFAIAAVDGRAASWRFKPLDSPWPWVLVTSPADARMAVRRDAGTSGCPLPVHALVLGRDVVSVELRIDDGPGRAMSPLAGRRGRWGVEVDRPVDGIRRIVVTARDATGRTAEDEIRLDLAVDLRADLAPGHADASVGTWSEHGVLGTRLGPNANGKDW